MYPAERDGGKKTMRKESSTQNSALQTMNHFLSLTFRDNK
jgi:hypothetical protein